MGIFSIFSSFNSLLSIDPNVPTVNIDGTPMIPNTNLDMHGNTYGVTDSLNSSSSMLDSSSSFITFNSFDS